MAKIIQNFELFNAEEKKVSLNQLLGEGKPIFIYIYIQQMKSLDVTDLNAHLKKT
ncbi:hypothetical protein [Sulfurihydrogenibium azorense]|uniref:hypothetical protein n=1 Tax=Sulfurihydrogenibium azorense TaxID=309806 RepID=UPI0024095F9E|nr:hypothetical protein [Sulfurihydrogenibium azorense]MDM7272879.1 hypothetical protein [Sulfurihydrogenibium azorense]